MEKERLEKEMAFVRDILHRMPMLGQGNAKSDEEENEDNFPSSSQSQQQQQQQQQQNDERMRLLRLHVQQEQNLLVRLSRCSSRRWNGVAGRLSGLQCRAQGVWVAE